MQHSQCMIHSASIQYILLYVFVMCYSDSEKCCSFTPKLVSLCFQDNYAFKIAFQESEICNSVLKLTVQILYRVTLLESTSNAEMVSVKLGTVHSVGNLLNH